MLVPGPPHVSVLNSARPGLANTAPADVCDIEPARLRWGVRDGRSNPLGSAGALEIIIDTRIPSAPPRRSKFLGLVARPACVSDFEPARLRLGARNGRSNPLGFAGAFEMAARDRSAPPGRSKLFAVWLFENNAHTDVSDFEPAGLRWGARNGRSSPLGSAGAFEMATRTRSARMVRSNDVSDFEPARIR